ncbi:MAG TPA: DNA-binding response regulator [Puia sp.]|nr:DNA-binding response regulator [Puia sp.]
MIASTTHGLYHPIPPRDTASAGTILLINHDKIELDLLSRQLGDAYAVLTAQNERTALHLLETRSIQLVISNMDLGYTDGGKLCAQLKTSVNYAHIPVILLIAGGPARIKSLESGADACMERPLSREYLKAQIKNLLTNRARIKNYFAHSLYAHMSSSSKDNEKFLHKLNDFISDNLENIDLDVDTLAKLMNMSRPTFYRKLKCVSDLTPNELINVARLNRAAELISTTRHKVCEIAKMVGFNSQSNFGKAFLKRFHVTPTEYQQMTAPTLYIA